MKDLCIRLALIEPLPNNYFGLVQKLIAAAPKIDIVKRFIYFEGAQMEFARMMMHMPKVEPVKMATAPPPHGKEHRRPELYFSTAMEGARVVEAQCSKDLIFERKPYPLKVVI
ncbi:Exocyst complex component 7 [Hordeum vulgare]|nr:Exocyst complex component 7 [Hordeum vulgare]